MIKIFEPLIIAFSMYSKIPVPTINWNENNMKYVMCYFPLVGIPIGLLEILWYFVNSIFGFGVIFNAAIATAIPVFITGGIHLDGFCDTIDGLSSHQTPEKKLEILKDPNSGAFAVIGCVLYILINFALWSEIHLSLKAVSIIALFYIISRSASGLSVVTFQLAKNTGLAAAFSDSAKKENVKITMFIYITILTLTTLFIEYRYGVFCILGVALVFVYYKYMSKKEFGGITGDLAGFFLQMAELFVLVGILISQNIFGVL